MGVRSTDLASPFFDRFLRTQNSGTNTTQLIGHNATGGVISDYTDGSIVYRAHIFTTSGAFTISSIGTINSTVDILNVAGGGGGSGSIPSYWAGAGGGAGGMIEVSGYPVTTSTYPVVIGAGGAGGATSGSNTPRGGTGVDSEFNNPGSTPISVISKGGGGGGGLGPASPGASQEMTLVEDLVVVLDLHQD